VSEYSDWAVIEFVLVLMDFLVQAEVLKSLPRHTLQLWSTAIGFCEQGFEGVSQFQCDARIYF